MKVYQYVVWRKPTDENKKAELLTGVETVLAQDEQHVRAIAVRALPEDVDLLAVMVEVRPF